MKKYILKTVLFALTVAANLAASSSSPAGLRNARLASIVFNWSGFPAAVRPAQLPDRLTTSFDTAGSHIEQAREERKRILNEAETTNKRPCLSPLGSFNFANLVAAYSAPSPSPVTPRAASAPNLNIATNVALPALPSPISSPALSKMVIQPRPNANVTSPVPSESRFHVSLTPAPSNIVQSQESIPSEDGEEDGEVAPSSSSSARSIFSPMSAEQNTFINQDLRTIKNPRLNSGVRCSNAGNKHAAIPHFEAVIEQNNDTWGTQMARFHLGAILVDGALNVPRDVEMGRKLLQQAVDQQINEKAQTQARRKLAELDSPRDVAVAISSSSSSSPRSQSVNNNPISPSISKPKRAAQAVQLGEAYLFGQGVEKNYATAYYYLRRARLLGYSNPAAYARSNLRLAQMHRDGLGIEAPDFELALLWFKWADEQKSVAHRVEAKPLLDVRAEAQLCLGEMYLRGQGVEANRATARSYFWKAARQTAASPEIREKAQGYLDEFDGVTRSPAIPSQPQGEAPAVSSMVEIASTIADDWHRPQPHMQKINPIDLPD